jgi:hypothetical protein
VKDFKKWLTREDKSSLLSLHSPDKLDSDTWVLEKETNDILQRMFSKSAELGRFWAKEPLPTVSRPAPMNITSIRA